MPFYLCSLLPKTQSNHEKSIRQIQAGGQYTKFLTSTPQNYQSCQKQGKSEKVSQSRGA